MKHLCIWLIRFYQKLLSPLKRTPTCRFVPTCSAYAIDAFQKRGFFMGMALTIWRILRCNPFCPGGYDPVPMRGFPIKGYYSIQGNEKMPNSDAEDAQGNVASESSLSSETADAPKLICEDYVYHRPRRQTRDACKDSSSCEPSQETSD